MKNIWKKVEVERKARLESAQKTEEDRIEAERRAEEECLKEEAELRFERMEILVEEKNALLEERPTLGRFSSYRRNEVKERLAEIESELKGQK